MAVAARNSAMICRELRRLTRNASTAPHPQSLEVDACARCDSRPNLRVALYSHDTMGLGHLRRNLVIASALADSGLNATSLLITGAHEANFFSLPPRSRFPHSSSPS